MLDRHLNVLMVLLEPGKYIALRDTVFH